MCGIAAIVLLKSAVLLLLVSFKAVIVLALLALGYVFLRGPRDGRR